MMKGLVVDENMSNLTSASSEISASSGTRNDTAHASLYPQHSSTSTNQEPQPKKKRNLPGNPDPEAEVIALSPKSLLATNRFICEICNKGFQRDQNLQLHRRGHNLPWKLKQRSNKEIRKKVYVCPETTCVHHDPSRALGDLTGIKKHFCRKHGEKKWKCDKCSKRYAVQSDWKAHSKICGTKEYKCDCGTLFSRRDSFVTHRAFCDALAQENGRAITAANPLLSSQTQLQYNLPVKKEIPPWLACPPVGEAASALRPLGLSSSLLPGPAHFDQSLIHNENPHPTTSLPSSYMSASALLQKASQIGVTANKFRPHQQIHMPECTTGYASSSMPPSSSSRDQMGTGFAHALASYGNKAGITSDYLEEGSPLFHDISATGFEDALRGMLNPTSDRNFQELAVSKSSESQFTKTNAGGASDELTRDFLGLKAFSQTHFFNISGLDHLGSSSYGKQNQNQTPWQG